MPALALVALVAFRADDPPPPTFESLSLPAQPKDRLVGQAREHANRIATAGAARFVGTVEGRKVYLAPSAGDTLCLLEIGPGGAGGGCGPRDASRHSVIWGASGSSSSETLRLRVLVPDAYRRVVLGRGLTARRVSRPVGGNAVLASVPPRDLQIRLEGDGVRSLSTTAKLEPAETAALAAR